MRVPWIKYYVTEPGSTWVRQIIDEQDLTTGQPHHIILVAEITQVETAAGLAVIERVGRIGKTTRERAYRRLMSQLIHRYAIIPLISTDFETTSHLTQQHPLKAYDAVQLCPSDKPAPHRECDKMKDVFYPLSCPQPGYLPS